MGPQPLYIRDQVPGRVSLQARIRGRFAATTLIEEQEVVSLRIELAPMLGRDAAARSAMQEQGRLRSLRSASLEIDLMAVTDVEHRSEERRVGKEGVSTVRSRWSPCH